MKSHSRPISIMLSILTAFVLAGRLDAQDSDWGDAPDPTYPTLVSSGGAKHAITGLALGGTVDPEPDGQPTVPADGDDLLDGSDDEDGVSFYNALIPGVPNAANVTVSGAGASDYLQAWIDFNGNGSWGDPGEQIATDLPVGNTVHVVPFHVPALPASGSAYARFRVSSQQGLADSGSAPDGEVEDYALTVDPIKWNQPPNLSDTGVDVDNTEVELADDWRCTATGPISDIHIWGSFLNDMEGVPLHVLQNMSFVLKVYSDIPASQSGTGYSMPGTLLWSYAFGLGTYQAGLKIPVDPAEWWHNPLALPPNDWVYPGDWNCYQFDFYPPDGEEFVQTNGVVYWLGLQVGDVPEGWQFGWKSTDITNHWNDDAVWFDGQGWKELTYGGSHPYAENPYPGNSMDLSFALSTPEEEEDAYDCGDAPDLRPGTAQGDYQTTLADNGAHHNVVTGAPYFDDGSGGDQPDSEPDGQPDPGALGDDNDTVYFPPINDDEDGITLPPLTNGMNGSVTITVNDGTTGAGGAYVDAWIDFDANGVWASPGERIHTGWLANGPQTIGFAVPAGSAVGQTFGRFRINSASAGLQPTGGPTADGEVEDHAVIIEEQPLDLDYGDAPDDQSTFFYPTLLANNGARHATTTNLHLGALFDLEWDGQPTVFSDGDDANNLADEDGIQFTTALITATPATVQATVTGGSGYLQGWMDWNNDGDWHDASEQIITDVAVTPGVNTIHFSVPHAATNTPVYARFRLSSTTGLQTFGAAQDGEVEDYLIDMEALKWLQIPERGSEGVDVSMTDTQLADDFKCNASGPITDIHLWGSFNDDALPPEGPEGLTVHVSIWSDIPAGTGGIPYSRPGVELWSKTYTPGTYTAGHIFYGADGEWWHNPLTGFWIFPGDFNIYQFDFYPQADEAFIQIEGTIYWLAVSYSYEGPGDFQFGWKTTPDTFNDDAVFWNPTMGYWDDLVYDEPTHPRYTESLELAFAISGNEQNIYDWGDAPDPTYPTYSSSVGARHGILTNFMLGASIDAELDGQPAATADGDNAAAFDDEDGITMSQLIRGSNASVNVYMTSGIGNGKLDAWVDFDKSGGWGPLERVISSATLTPGANPLSFPVPGGSALGNSFARFRLTLSGISTPGGAAPEGEVEDYPVVLLQPTPSVNIAITNMHCNISNLLATVMWNSQSGMTYRMQATTNLTVSNSWTNVGSYVTGPTCWQTNSMSGISNKFYRITAPWTP